MVLLLVCDVVLVVTGLTTTLFGRIDWTFLLFCPANAALIHNTAAVLKLIVPITCVSR